MCGRGRSCSCSCWCRLCCCLFLRWKQIKRPARTMATGYLVRWRRNYEHPPGYLCCSLLDLRPDSFITCLIEVFIECRTRRCVRQRLVLLVFRAGFPKKIDARVCRHFYCGPAKAFDRQANKAAAGNSLPVVDSCWFWCGRDGNAWTTENLT